MPEQGPTEAIARNDLAYRIATDVIGIPERADGLAEWLASGDNTDLGVAVRRLVESARARHVREAVEGLSIDDVVHIERMSIATARKELQDGATIDAAKAAGHRIYCAALLDALGGNDTTTPNPQNRP